MSEVSSTDLDRLRQIVLQRLESLQRAGLSILPHPTGDERWLIDLVGSAAPAETSANAAPPPSRFEMRPTNTRPSALPAASSPPTSNPLPTESEMPRRASSSTEGPAPKTLADRQAALEVLSAEVKQCRLCSELVRNRTQTVFGVGNVKPRIVFFGEAPGADEDRQGEPFVGRAGQLLTKIIEACGFKRSDVYIMNVLKCRPPDNRTPTEEETECCRPFFERQLAILQPEYIVCVGAVPMKALLKTTKSVGQMRGKFHEFQGRKVVITYHPAYLLRNPDAKKFVWEDMKMLLKDMGLEPPSAKG